MGKGKNMSMFMDPQTYEDMDPTCPHCKKSLGTGITEKRFHGKRGKMLNSLSPLVGDVGMCATCGGIYIYGIARMIPVNNDEEDILADTLPSRLWEDMMNVRRNII